MGEMLGKVKYLALSAHKEWVACYTQPDTEGNVVLLLADLSRELNRQVTGHTGATQLNWCGNLCMVLNLHESLCLVGPSDNTFVPLQSQAEGIYCTTESDGLRVVTATDTYFLDLVQDSTQQTLGLASISPSAKLHNAKKQDDYKNPRADEIIRDLGPELNEGI